MRPAIRRPDPAAIFETGQLLAVLANNVQYGPRLASPHGNPRAKAPLSTRGPSHGKCSRPTDLRELTPHGADGKVSPSGAALILPATAAAALFRRSISLPARTAGITATPQRAAPNSACLLPFRQMRYLRY